MGVTMGSEDRHHRHPSVTARRREECGPGACEDECVPSEVNCRVRYNSSRLSSEVMTVLRSWSWLPSQETMQQMAKKATAVYVESVEDLRGSPPHVD